MYAGEDPGLVAVALTTKLALVNSVFAHALPHVSAAPPSMRVESATDRLVVLAAVTVVKVAPLFPES